MNNFTFENTTRIHFGQGQIAQIFSEIPKDKKVLVLYGGGSIKKNGVYDQVAKALKDHSWEEFSGIEPNPQYDTLMKAVEKIEKEGFDYLLAIGGGSIIDGTKFIAAASKFEAEDPWDICAKSAPVKDALPLACVLTLPATGSESNIGAVISRGNDKLHFHNSFVRPKFAILDPETTLSLSKRQISNGVIDAFVHIMEQYLTYPVNAKVQDRFSEGLLMTLMEEGPKALKDPEDLSVRSNIMWSASMALNQLIGSGVPQDWSTHMIGHEITGIFGVDHARSLSIVLPAVMKVQSSEKQEKILQYANHVLGINEGTVDERIDIAINKTIEFFRAMEVPTSLQEVGIKSKDIDSIVSSLQKHDHLALGEKGDITIDKSKLILETAL